jgi:hypothetical protein
MVSPHDPTKSAIVDTKVAPAAGALGPPGPEVPEAVEPAPPPPSIPGFNISKKLGQGGQGSVWLAESIDALGKQCALKVFPQEQKASYARELEAWRRVEEIRRATGTPHLVEGYAAGSTKEGLAFVAMAFFEHGSLADRLAADGPFKSAPAVRYARHVLAALDLLHQHGLFHRDVKPQNVLLGNDGIARLADYGLSKKLGASVTGSCTPAFAAPEQLVGEAGASGVKIDIYGVAAMLFALLTGRPPVPGRPDLFLLERCKVPRAIQAPLLRALSPDPAVRPDRAADFARALAQAEPTSSSTFNLADLAAGLPASELAPASPMETRAQNPDAPLDPEAQRRRVLDKPDDSRLTATTEGRKARRARLLVAFAGGLAVVALGLDALRDRRAGFPDTRIGGGIDPVATGAVVVPPGVPDPIAPIDPTIALSARKEPLPLLLVRWLAASPEGIALTGSASTFLARPGSPTIDTYAVAAARAVPWSRDRLLLALPEGDLELAGSLGVWPIPLPGRGRVVALAGHAETRRIAVARRSGAVVVFALDPGEVVRKGWTWRLPEPRHETVTGLAFDAPGDRLAVSSIGPDGTGRVSVYTLEDGESPRLASALDREGPTAVAWVGADLLAVGSVEGELALIDARDGTLSRTFPVIEGAISSLALTPSSGLLLVLGDDRRLEPEGAAPDDSSIVVEDPAGARLRFARKPHYRLLGFRVKDLQGRGESSAVLDATELDCLKVK